MKREQLKNWVMLLLFLLVGTVELSAQQKQKFSVASFEIDQFDLTAKTEPNKKVDGNGNLYAIIKVTSNNPDDDLLAYNFNFGNMNHEVVQKDDELWVYVQRNAKYVTISRQGYTTINKYDLKTTIEEGRTYVMQLSVTAAPVYTQMVQFAIEPVSSKAVVMIKSSKTDAHEELFGNADNNGAIAKSLPFGTYTYRVMAENYHSSEGRFTLNDRKNTHIEKVILRPNFSEVTLQVDANADIYVNGEKKGIRVWKGIMKAGSYQIECRQTNHRNSSQYITVEENDNRTFTLTPPTPITGTLAITSQPLGASIRIDGKDYGVTPQNINDLLIGRHTVTISKQNYKSESKTVDIEENNTFNLDVKLSDIAKMTINSRPSNSSLYIDDQFVGNTPYTAEMGSGDYNIMITHPNYHEFKQKVHLDSSHPQVTLTLDRQYQNSNVFYVQTGIQVGSLIAAEATLGGFISNFNIEGTFLYGLNKSEALYWNSQSGNRPMESIFTPMVFGGKVGYGIIVGTRYRFTPQLGLSIVSISDDSKQVKANATSANMGVKAEMAVASNIGLFVAPEFSFAVAKSDTYKQLEKVSTKIKGWGTGINVRLGMNITF